MNCSFRISERCFTTREGFPNGSGEINGPREGLIRVGTFNSVSSQWLPGMIKRFQAQYPAIRFESLHGTDTQITGWVADGRVDLGFVAYPTREEFSSDFSVPGSDRRIFAEDDPHSSMETFPVSKLAESPYIALNEGGRGRDHGNFRSEPGAPGSAVCGV